ncbi:hypothetical protein ZIOFF_028458 [Zingiber officinale]|uniref:DNA topoisomerase I DNA binding eukaryotic-type domain-containing protein n=1 Tax=Zingiber officinale TaxID=94328 RepID=A0A8J5GLB4_ZINOF|nr:hypothetical protein ZIOFF_028458 [Zingiber officinale]
MGKLKNRIKPRDITINIGKDAPIPECSIPGESVRGGLVLIVGFSYHYYEVTLSSYCRFTTLTSTQIEASALTISKVLSIYSLLIDSNPDDPLVPEIIHS